MVFRSTAFAGAVTAALLAAAPADAALLKGTISGQPYVAGPTRTAVPVIFSTQTAKRFGLRAQTGVLLVPRRGDIPTPDGAIRPFALRLGDRFRFDIEVPVGTRRSSFARLAVPRLVVTKRSKALSTAELEAQLVQTRRKLDELERFTAALSAYTVQQVGGLRADVTTLSGGLAAVRDDVADLRTDLAALAGALEAAEDRIDGLDVLVAGLQQQLAAVTATLETQASALTALKAQLEGLLDRIDRIEGLLAGIGPGQLTSVVQQLTTVTNLVAAVQTELDTLTGALDPGTLLDRVDALESALGSVSDVEALATQATALSGDLAELNARVDALDAQVLALQDDLTKASVSTDGLCSLLPGC